nr:EamA family transporter [Planococcus glaciei]
MNRVKGIAMIISGAMLWGATGPLMQWSLGTFGFSPEFLSTVRLILAGLLLLGFFKVKRRAGHIHFQRKDLGSSVADFCRIRHARRSVYLCFGN